MQRLTIAAVILIATMPLLSCAGKRPTDLGVAAGTFTACPSSPNCVSSDASDGAHRIAPLQLAVAPATAWPAIREFVATGMPRTAIVTEQEGYLHAECRSAMLGFVDDLELHLRPAGIIAVRSASRIGRSDFGVNRSRVEDLRAALIKQGIVR